MKRWFKHTNHASVKILHAKDVDKPSITITDKTYIARLVTCIDGFTMSPHADANVMGPLGTPWQLWFCTSDQQCDAFTWDNQRIQTTLGFYDLSDKEAAFLTHHITPIIIPQFNSPLPVVEGVHFQFPDFTVTYFGQQISDPAPVTVSFVTDRFQIATKTGDTLELKITSGQRSPQPQAFTAGGQTYTLLRYELASGARLYPNYFAIQRGSPPR